eukprot:3885251-Prymnesium_polylepis.1
MATCPPPPPPRTGPDWTGPDRTGLGWTGLGGESKASFPSGPFVWLPLVVLIDSLWWSSVVGPQTEREVAPCHTALVARDGRQWTALQRSASAIQLRQWHHQPDLLHTLQTVGQRDAAVQGGCRTHREEAGRRRRRR